jgi:hypothetical protein
VRSQGEAVELIEDAHRAGARIERVCAGGWVVSWGTGGVRWHVYQDTPRGAAYVTPPRPWIDAHPPEEHPTRAHAIASALLGAAACDDALERAFQRSETC